VVIYGESGTGKELVAHAIHSVSQRSAKPFVTVNCSAIPESLFESELFGHVKGAYTGATESRKGLFQEANGGTLFLDEIGEIPLALQAKLLRVLQEGEVRRVGENRPVRVDVRLVSATNKDLQKAVETGEFRQDLFYRINVIPIRIPPLRDRREDIPLLANHFLEQANRRLEKRREGFTREAMRRLLDYSWPGNVRELENKVKQSALLARGDLVEVEDILIEDGAAPAATPSVSGTYKEAKKVWERQYLEGLLRKHRGNVSRAAEEAGRYRADFYNLVNKHSLKADDFRQ
jgi:two-component system response regulator GlrR